MIISIKTKLDVDPRWEDDASPMSYKPVTA